MWSEGETPAAFVKASPLDNTSKLCVHTSKSNLCILPWHFCQFVSYYTTNLSCESKIVLQFKLWYLKWAEYHGLLWQASICTADSVTAEWLTVPAETRVRLPGATHNHQTCSAVALKTVSVKRCVLAMFFFLRKDTLRNGHCIGVLMTNVVVVGVCRRDRQNEGMPIWPFTAGERMSVSITQLTQFRSSSAHSPFCLSVTKHGVNLYTICKFTQLWRHSLYKMSRSRLEYYVKCREVALPCFWASVDQTHYVAIAIYFRSW